MNKIQLYNPKITTIYKNLQYFKKELDTNKIINCNEIRICGFRICLELEIKDNIITSIYFSGVGDCISIVSTEILCRNVRNKYITEVLDLINNFIKAIENKNNYIFNTEIQYLVEISIYQNKIKNIMMSWINLKNILNTYNE